MEIGRRSLAKAVPSRVLPVEERTPQDEQEDREDCKWPVSECLHGNSSFRDASSERAGIHRSGDI